MDKLGPGHARAESGGETRLLRCSHGEDVLYTRLARRARDLWLELGGGVLEETGVAWLARRADGWEADSERVLRAEGIPVDRMAPEEARRLLPGLSPAGLAHVLYEPEAGVLHAARGVRALAERAREHGARLELGEAAPGGWRGAGRRSGARGRCRGVGMRRLARPALPGARIPAGDPPAAHALRGRPRLGRRRMGGLRRALVRARSRRAARIQGRPRRRRPVRRSRRPPARGHRAGRPRGPRLPGHALPRAGGCAGGLRPRLPLQPHARLQLPVRRPPRPARACGCSEAARDTASSTAPRWPSTWPPCWAAALRRSPASRSASAAPGGASERRDPLRSERAPPPAAAGARHSGHPGIDRGAGAAPGGDRQGVRRLARRGRPGPLGAGRHGRGGVAGDRAGHRPLGSRAADRRRGRARNARRRPGGRGSLARVVLPRRPGHRSRRGLHALGGLRGRGLLLQRGPGGVGDGLGGRARRRPPGSWAPR